MLAPGIGCPFDFTKPLCAKALAAAHKVSSKWGNKAPHRLPARAALLDLIEELARNDAGGEFKVTGWAQTRNSESASLNRMALDLETLRTEILTHLRMTGMAVFHAAHRSLDPLNQVLWDVERHPDYRAFLAVAEQAGAKLMQFHHQTLSVEQIDGVLDELEDCDLTREEKRAYEKRLRQLREYEGFTCSVELSFCLDSKIYVFEQHTDWYESLTDIVAEIEAVSDDGEEDDGSLGGYFSNN